MKSGCGVDFFSTIFINPDIWSEHEIEFLDVKVLNESGVLETDVFITPTVINIYMTVLVIRVRVK